MAQDEKIFADGFMFKRNEKAPEFVIGRLSMKVDEAIAFMKENEKSGWVNLNIKTARSGNYYVELDTYDPKGTSSTPTNTKAPAAATTKKASPKNEEEDEELPF